MQTKALYPLFLFFFIATNSLLAQEDLSESKNLYHALLIEWKEDAAQDDKNEVLEIFKNLPSKIDGFEAVSFKKLIRSNKGHSLLILMRFSDESALQVYQEHPEHLRIKKIGMPLIADLSKHDYWD